MIVVRPLALGVVGLLAWCWPFSKPGLEVVTVLIPKSCADSGNKIGKTVDKSDRDVLVWSVASECAEPVYVTITPATHPVQCVGEPKDANLGNPFPLDPGKTAYVVCTIDYPVDDVFTPISYPFSVVFQRKIDFDAEMKAGNAMDGAGKLGGVRPRASELALEVEP